MAEWFKAAVLKTVEGREVLREFESLSLRQEDSEIRAAEPRSYRRGALSREKKYLPPRAPGFHFFERENPLCARRILR
jgi:hypothetical protein